MLEALIPALLPVVADGVRGVFNRFTGGAGAAPSNVGEVIQLMSAETDRLKTLAELDAAGNVSTWVANVRALQRPVASFLIISAYVVAVAMSAPTETLEGVGAYAQMVPFYLFGDRTYTYLRGRKG